MKNALIYSTSNFVPDTTDFFVAKDTTIVPGPKMYVKYPNISSKEAMKITTAVAASSKEASKGAVMITIAGSITSKKC